MSNKGNLSPNSYDLIEVLLYCMYFFKCIIVKVTIYDLDGFVCIFILTFMHEYQTKAFTIHNPLFSNTCFILAIQYMFFKHVLLVMKNQKYIINRMTDKGYIDIDIHRHRFMQKIIMKERHKKTDKQQK